MNLLSIEKIAKTWHDTPLFQNVTFGIEEGDKFALIGPNGSGKTTLFRIIAGLDEPDEGIVSRNLSMKTAILSQKIDFVSGNTILEHVLSGDNPLFSLVRRYELALAEGKMDEISHLSEQIDAQGGWKIESEIKSILHALGIRDFFQKVETLSGGMLRKVELARLFVCDATLLILDEPTNHLDLNTTLWLQENLVKTSKTILLVTHDRYFLDAVSNRIAEISDGNLVLYNGNYSRYLELKEIRMQTETNRKKRIETLLRREIEWMKRGPKARTTKQQARIDRFDDLVESKVTEKEGMSSFSTGDRRLGKQVLELHNIEKSFDGRQILQSFSYAFKRGERVGIVGRNGSGKTTLLNIISGRIEPDSGFVKAGVNTVFGFFEQTSKKIREDQNIVDFLKDEAELAGIHEGHVVTIRQLLEKFLFPPQMFHTKIGRLSGGERRRIELIRILMTNPNFLILDEPTNDFDIQTLSLLEEFLQEYSGTLVVVSHDRFFLDKTIDFLFVVEESGEVRSFPGDASSFLESEKRKQEQLEKEGREAKKITVQNLKEDNPTKAKSKLTFKEQQEFQQIEKEIEILESKKSEIELKFSSAGFSYENAGELHETYEKIKIDLATKMARWEELAIYAG